MTICETCVNEKCPYPKDYRLLRSRYGSCIHFREKHKLTMMLNNPHLFTIDEIREEFNLLNLKGE